MNENMGVRGYFLKRRKFHLQNLTKDWKQPPVVILQKSIFCNIFFRWFWLRMIRTSDQSVYLMNFPLHIFLTISIMVTEQLYRRKVLCGCFPFIWLCLLIAIMKRCAERCTLQLYRTSLNHKMSGFQPLNIFAKSSGYASVAWFMSRFKLT